MTRGEVWWVDFFPMVGGEIRTRRPAIIVSNDASNEVLNRVQVVPLTSRTGKCYPSEAFVTVRGRTQKAMADQLTTVSKSRVSRLAGRVIGPDMQSVDAAMRLQLGLSD
jgi:mRNA interferase MazF